MRPLNTKPATQPATDTPAKPAAAAAPKPAAAAAAKPAEVQKRPPVTASFTPEKNGGATLKLEYAGGLAQYEAVWVRMGERRAGHDWLNTRDVKLEKVGSMASTKIMLAPGDPIEGATFAFHAKKGSEELWDNAGRAFGCYVYDAKTGTISAQ